MFTIKRFLADHTFDQDPFTSSNRLLISADCILAISLLTIGVVGMLCATTNVNLGVFNHLNRFHVLTQRGIPIIGGLVIFGSLFISIYRAQQWNQLLAQE